MARSVPRLWHISDYVLCVGDVVPPAAFGQSVMAGGAHIPSPGVSYFFREYLFEYVRAMRTQVPVSRLACAFAFESQQIATIAAEARQQPCYEVAPADPQAPISRHDMEWVSRAGAANTAPAAAVEAIERYWAGEAAPSDTIWEWLSSSGLRVIR